jgi:hypothetical protein
MKRTALSLVFALTACGTTGEQIVTFRAAAAGAADVNGPADFSNDRGFHVVLSQAKLNIGALYLNQSIPVSGANATDCVLPGTYVGQVTEGTEVDLLSAALQYLPVGGQGTTLPALAGEVWYVRQAPASDGTAAEIDVNDSGAVAQVLTIDGIADKGGQTFPFTGNVTIGPNRMVPSPNPALPGSKPICKERIVSPIPLAVTLREGGTLTLRIDARELLRRVDFSTLKPSAADPSTYVFGDSSTRTEDINQASTTLYQAIQSAGGPASGGPYDYAFTP